MDPRSRKKALSLSILPRSSDDASGGPFRKQVLVPLLPHSQGLTLIVARGPSLDCETIHAWLHVVDAKNAPGPLMVTFAADLSDCAIIRDGEEPYPVLKVGQAQFRINEHSASQLRARLKFTDRTTAP